MMAFWISFAVSAATTYAALRYLRFRRERLLADEKRAAEAAVLFQYTMACMVRQRIQHQILMAHWERQLELVKMEAAEKAIDEARRAANREDAIDSVCAEVAAKRRLN